jgi:uncharacterized membrane protein YqjE
MKDSFQRLVDGLQQLFREHLALARLELREDMKRIVKDVALSAAGLPLLLIGYALAMVSLGLLLALVIPAWAGMGIVALVNLGAGAALALVFGKRIGKQDKLELTGTADELSRDKQWMATLKAGTRPQPLPGALPPAAAEPIEGKPAAATNGRAVPLPGPTRAPAGARSTLPGAGRTH